MKSAFGHTGRPVPHHMYGDLHLYEVAFDIFTVSMLKVFANLFVNRKFREISSNLLVLKVQMQLHEDFVINMYAAQLSWSILYTHY